ncbi:hypothetical protein P280DRAFT_473463 [Massarina eburnea CBS 473.64]|uniref:Uncharacterized protein n=1 Tax=Massarina eburnea CBS 473.64 TaxID=1395130 RepID=A0A6A6RLU6_9PLEO|nr:hypothetical protein P280DRAFT_473463 [Massarina eburnea CBS 473.64]
MAEDTDIELRVFTKTTASTKDDVHLREPLTDPNMHDLTKNVHAKFPRRVRKMVYQFVLDIANVEGVTTMDDLKRDQPSLIPQRVHSKSTSVFPGFLEEFYQVLYASIPHRVRTIPIDRYMSSDPFGVGFTPADIQIKALHLTIPAASRHYRRIVQDLEYLLTLNTVMSGFKLYVKLDQFPGLYTYKIEQLYEVYSAFEDVVQEIESREGEVCVEFTVYGETFGQDLNQWRIYLASQL